MIVAADAIDSDWQATDLAVDMRESWVVELEPTPIAEVFTAKRLTAKVTVELSRVVAE